MTTDKGFDNNRGLAIPEVLISVTIGAVLFAIVFSMWYFGYKSWNFERMKSTLRIDLEGTMERINREVRLSSTTYMSLYRPTGETEYTAISFPMATTDASGFFSLDEEVIYWDRSIIYHIYDNPETGYTELRRTEFTNNHYIIIDSGQRSSQLVSVVGNGDGAGAPNGGNATTKVIIKRLTTFTVIPEIQKFDGYNSEEQRSDKIEFGSVRLEPGEHDLRFEVVDKDSRSSDYRLGIDTISITPNGCLREGEFYTPVDSSGDSYSRVYAPTWSGDNYLEYQADGVGDYCTLRLYYDLLRESNFADFVRANTVLTGQELFIKLATPKEGEQRGWHAALQTEVTGLDFPNPLTNMTIRNILSTTTDPRRGRLVRVKFLAHSENPLVINEAWIVERDEGYNGTGTAVQLYFSDPPFLNVEGEPQTGGTYIGGTQGVTPSSVTIPAGHAVWSNWADFPIEVFREYFVTFYIPSESYLTYWHPETAPPPTNSYYRPGNYVADITWTDSAESPITSAPDIYGVEEIRVWSPGGYITSPIYDTTLADPAYNQIGWSAFKPEGTDIVVKARSSDSSIMYLAPPWAAITGSSVNPHSLSIGSGRYLQFQATLTKDADFDDYDNYPRIDNVTVDWPGQERICKISGYFTQKPNYGVIKLTVDGQELVKSLDFGLTVSEDYQGQTYETSLTTEVEPRNTGR